MKKKANRKFIIIGIIVVLIIIIFSIIGIIIHKVDKEEQSGKKINYETSYEAKVKKEKDAEIMKSFYGSYIITGVNETSPSIQLTPGDLTTLDGNLIGAQVTIEANEFTLKYSGTTAVNGINYSNVNVENPNYEVNQTDSNMFNYVYKITPEKAGAPNNTPYFINVGVNNNFEQEIIQGKDNTLILYNQGVFFKLEPAAKILAKKNAELVKYANDALSKATGNTYKYIFPVAQTQKDGKFEYKKVDSSSLFMCSNKNDGIEPDKDTMFIQLDKGVVKPDTTDKTNDKKDQKDEKDKNVPFYNFTIKTLAVMNETSTAKPIVGEVYVNGDVSVKK